MEYRYLGRTGVQVSKLGFGTMSFGQDADPATSKVLFQRCREAGINLFDCANIYGKGRSEEILGALIADCRDEIILTTKAYYPTGQDINAQGGSRYHLVRAVEASLKRLGTDRVDVFFLHRFDDRTALEETLRGVEHLVQAGKVLYAAASNFAAWQVARALGVAERLGFAPMVALQPMYNLVKRQAEVELLPLAQSEGLAVFPYSPLGGGLLTGKYGTQARPASGRLVDHPMYRIRYGEPAVYEIAERFLEVAGRHGHAPAALAISWVAAHPAVTAPLIGARNLDQLEACLAGAHLPMDPELYAEIAGLSPAPAPATDRNDEIEGHAFVR